MIRQALDLSSAAFDQVDAAATSTVFHDALTPLGISYMQARRYRRPATRLTPRAHWSAGGFVARFGREGWIGSGSSDYVCFDCNPLIAPVAKGVTRFRFGDYAPHGDRRFGRYWDAMSEGGIGDALASVAYGRSSAIASLHIGFRDTRVDQPLLQLVHAAASLVAERLLTFDAEGVPDEPGLSVRERDAIAFVADGKTDWEIGTIMGVAETTARFHVDNARRKLGAVNRAHAVTRYLALYGHA